VGKRTGKREMGEIGERKRETGKGDSVTTVYDVLWIRLTTRWEKKGRNRERETEREREKQREREREREKERERERAERERKRETERKRKREHSETHEVLSRPGVETVATSVLLTTIEAAKTTEYERERERDR
jgi:FtsZ-interacting cell division protein YlmF